MALFQVHKQKGFDLFNCASKKGLDLFNQQANFRYFFLVVSIKIKYTNTRPDKVYTIVHHLKSLYIYMCTLNMARAACNKVAIVQPEGRDHALNFEKMIGL